MAFLDLIIHPLDQIGPRYKEWLLLWFNFDRLAGLRVVGTGQDLLEGLVDDELSDRKQSLEETVLTVTIEPGYIRGAGAPPTFAHDQQPGKQPNKICI